MKNDCRTITMMFYKVISTKSATNKILPIAQLLQLHELNPSVRAHFQCYPKQGTL
jgi:hypothetical protein